MKIEYNLISRGTKLQSDCEGYMAISEVINGKRYILPLLIPDIKFPKFIQVFSV